MTLAENLHIVETTIARALTARREDMIIGSAVTLVAVTKNHPPEIIKESLAAGIQHIGENRVQEARHKQAELGHNGVWHLIGHLQTNKARQAVAMFDLIESVDSTHLFATIAKEAERIGKKQDILLQLNIAGEAQKYGFSREEYLQLLPQIDSFSSVNLRGLMVIAPLAGDVEMVRPVFAAGYRAFCRLHQQCPWVDILSMGMSGDYRVAIEEGANTVRIGTALFGLRDYSK